MKPTNQSDILHPIVALVKPTHRGTFNLKQTLYVLKCKKQGLTNREIAKRYFAATGKDLSTERIGKIARRYKEGMKYV